MNDSNDTRLIVYLRCVDVSHTGTIDRHFMSPSTMPTVREMISTLVVGHLAVCLQMGPGCAQGAGLVQIQSLRSVVKTHGYILFTSIKSITISLLIVKSSICMI